jgi:hypothetical protein
MNYSMKNKRRFRNIMMSWVTILVIGLLVGFTIGKIGQADSAEAIAQFKEIEPYGTIDGKTFTWGLSKKWTSGVELGFVPLEVGLNEELQEFIYCLSYSYNIDYAFVMGLIETESTFNPGVISSTNDYGLMQINTVNHEWLKEKLSITDFLDPYQNTRSGLYILRNLFEKYEDPEKVLMAYNLGENGAKKLWSKGVYETNYTKKVIKNAQEFKDYIDERKDKND